MYCSSLYLEGVDHVLGFVGSATTSTATKEHVEDVECRLVCCPSLLLESLFSTFVVDLSLLLVRKNLIG